jgi:hypothetical protein
VAAVAFAPKARRDHKNANTRSRWDLMLLVVRVLVVARVGRVASNDVDGRPCLRVEYFSAPLRLRQRGYDLT